MRKMTRQLKTLIPDWLRRPAARADQPLAPQLLTPQQRWSLATGAQLTNLNGGSHGSLNPEPGADRAEWLSGLARWWGVETREELQDRLEVLEVTGHRAALRGVLGHEPLAWDLVRAINLARWGHGAGLLSEEEAWGFVLRAAGGLRRRYRSWAELGGDYVLAHDLWAGEADPALDEVTRQLLDPANGDSPWQRLRWEAFDG